MITSKRVRSSSAPNVISCEALTKTDLRLQGGISCGCDDGLRGRLYCDHRGRSREAER